MNSSQTAVVSCLAKVLCKSLPVTAAIALVLTPSALAAKFADFIFVVDESGSMSAEYSWLGSIELNINSFPGQTSL